MNRHDCPGEGCGVCAAAIEDRESLEDRYPSRLSVQRADGTWRRGADWHVPADAPRTLGGGL